MSGKNQHVVPHDSGWAVKEIAQNQESEMLVHGKNGQIRERNSYGNDPYPPKG